jgi:hypothetical protein
MFNEYTWRDAMYPLVTKWFDDEYDKNTNIIDKIIDVDDMDRYEKKNSGAGGVGEIPDYDGTNLIELARKRGFTASYIGQEKAGIYRIGYKAAKFDMSGEAKKAGQVLSNGLYMTVLMSFYRMFANGFNGDFKGPDTKALFATDHPVNSTDADTYSNKGTSVLSVKAITESQAKARRFTTYDGLPFQCKFDMALVSPELDGEAKRIFGENAKLYPDSAENGANPVGDIKFQVIDGFSAKQWAIGDSRLMKMYMHLYYGTRPKVIDQKGANPLIAEYIPYVDYVLGWDDPRVIFGHDPA